MYDIYSSLSCQIGRKRQLPNSENAAIEELELAIDCSEDKRERRRLRAIHLILCGGSFELTQAHSRVSERALEIWIARYNQTGIDGLTCRPIVGRPRSVSKQTVEEVILPVIEKPALADQTHWTVTKLVGWLQEKKDLKIAYSTLVRYLHEHDYKLKIPARFQSRRIWKPGKTSVKPLQENCSR